MIHDMINLIKKHIIVIMYISVTKLRDFFE